EDSPSIDTSSSSMVIAAGADPSFGSSQSLKPLGRLGSKKVFDFVRIECLEGESVRKIETSKSSNLQEMSDVFRTPFHHIHCIPPFTTSLTPPFLAMLFERDLSFSSRNFGKTKGLISAMIRGKA